MVFCYGSPSRLRDYPQVAPKSIQSCPTLCDPIDGSPPGSPIPGILQARTLERVAISFSNAWEWKVKVKLVSHVWLLVTLWTAAHQAPPSVGFPRQEYWSGLPLPSPCTGLVKTKPVDSLGKVKRILLKIWHITDLEIWTCLLRMEKVWDVF